MAKPNKSKSSGPRGNSVDTVKIIALLVFIAIGISVIGGAVWYYAFFQPRTTEAITDATDKFTQDYFNVSHTDITGAEGEQWMTETLAKADGDRVSIWKDREIVSRVEGDIQVQILDQGLRTARARATFWQYEELEEKAGKEYLVYYDYAFVYQDGDWLIAEVLTASEEGLKDLRRSRGVYDQHYADKDDEEALDQDEGDQGESE